MVLLGWCDCLGHGHSADDPPVFPGFDPCVEDAVGVSGGRGVFILPLIREPVTHYREVACDLNAGRFELNGLECEAFLGLRGDPVGDVIFSNRLGTDGRPAEEMLVPEIPISGKIVRLHEAPVGMLKIPDGLFGIGLRVCGGKRDRCEQKERSHAKKIGSGAGQISSLEWRDGATDWCGRVYTAI